MTTKLLFLAGSQREGSVNKKLAKTASEIAKNKGADVTYIDIADYEIPLFNQDLMDESGLPEKAVALKKLFIQSDGICIACPEYNSGITPQLKNIIDWLSRSETPQEESLMAFKGKIFGLVSASPGALGGLRSIYSVREILMNIMGFVVPQHLAIGNAYDKFDEHDYLTDEADKKNLTGVIEKFVAVSAALKDL